LRIDYEVRDQRELEQGNDPKRKLWPEDAYSIMNKISEEHLKQMGLNKDRSNPANMIIHNLAVAPPPVRPSVQMSNTPRSEDDLTVAYKMIIKQNNEIARTKAHAIPTTNNNLRDQLQFFVATVMDNDI
jgi:DNA-directed RNA polymerase beta' subunit